jgi:hypothetical protein
MLGRKAYCQHWGGGIVRTVELKSNSELFTEFSRIYFYLIFSTAIFGLDFFFHSTVPKDTELNPEQLLI